MIAAPDQNPARGPATGAVVVEDARIVAVLPATVPAPDPAPDDRPEARPDDRPAVVRAPPGGWIMPGLVDIHCHGGGGAGFDEGGVTARAAADFHRQRGVTSIVASLVSAPRGALLRQVGELAPLVADGTLMGIHLEGPYLSPTRRGAHDPATLREPDLGELRELLAAGAGTIAMVTLAPELPGALAAVDLLVARGVRVAVGHTDATAAQTRAALSHGATVATHLFNGMRPLHHREPGPVLAICEDRSVFAELIADGHHLAADVLRASMRLLGQRAVLVSDAVAAAGRPDGRYRLGGTEVALVGGVVRTTDGSLAGSTLTLASALRTTVESGVALAVAVHAATAAPAAALGLASGALAVGQPADLVVLDGSLAVSAVMRAGRWVDRTS